MLIQHFLLQEMKLGSEDLQQMLRFGATQIFQTKEATITDEDIVSCKRE